MDYPLQTSKLYLGIVAAVFSIHFSKHPPTLDFFFFLQELENQPI